MADLGNFALLQLALFGFFGSLTLAGLMIFAGINDVPGERSSHASPTPTGGGIGIVGGVGVALMASAWLYGEAGDGLMVLGVLALCVVIAVLGFLDDLYELSPVARLSLEIGLAFLLVNWIGRPEMFPLGEFAWEIPDWLGWVGAILWVVVVMNVVNFMDGANGLMGAFMLFAALSLSLIAAGLGAGATAILAIALVGGLAGFLPYNMNKKAEVFSGDVGSLFTGCLFAAAGLLLVRETPDTGSIYIVPLLILPFLTDVLLTLVVRIAKGGKVWIAHREHLYHKMIDHGLSHVAVARLYGVAAVLCGVAGMFALKGGAAFAAASLAAAVVLSVTLYIWLRRQL